MSESVENNQFIPTTSCQSCVFTTKKDDIQTGCQLNRLEKFRDNGAIVQWPDNYNAYCKINRYCSSLRTEEWSKNKDPNNLIDIVKAEIRIHPEAILIVHNNDLDNLKLRINEIIQQTILPSKIIIVNFSKLRPSEIVNVLQNQSIVFRLDQINTRTNISLYEALNNTIRQTESYHAIFIDENKLLEENFIEKINCLINDEMKRYVAILPQEQGHAFIHTNVYNTVENLSYEECKPFLSNGLFLSNMQELYKLINYYANKINQTTMIYNYEKF